MSVEEQLGKALREGRFSACEVGAGDECTRATLLARLADLQNVDLPPWESLEQAVLRPGSLLLSQQEANLLYFCDQVFEQCHSQTDLEQVLLDAFMALRPLVAGVLLRDTAILPQLQHPLFSLLDRLWDAGRYWSPDLGKPGDKYRVRLNDMLLQLRKADPVTAPFSAWLEELSGQLIKDAQRAETLISRICQTARGVFASEQAEQVVREHINTLLARAPMPDVVEELLKGPLRHSLQVIYLGHGAHGDEWKQATRSAHLLIDSMQRAENETELQRIYQYIPKVIPLLTKQLVSISDEAEMESWMGRIEKLHMQILLGSKLELHPAQPLSTLSDKSGVNANVSSALLEQVKQIEEGQWLIYQRDDGEKMRCRLVMKTEGSGQLLFVNILGAKCLEKSLEDFAYLLAARHVRLLDADNNFSQIFRDTVASFLQLHQRQSLLMTEVEERQRIEGERRHLAQQKAKREAERIAQERLEAQVRADEQAHLYAEEQAQLSRVQAAQKSAVEAEHIRREAELKAERTLQAEKQARIHEWELVQQSVHTLGIGAWVDIEINGERQRCKLAAVMNASDKLIFVGRDGKKLAEPRRDELIKLLLDGKAKIIQQGDQFENSLAKVIQTLRKD